MNVFFLYDCAMRKFIVLLIAIGIIFGMRSLWYRQSLAPVDSSSTKSEVVKIAEGSSLKTIANLLEEKALIRSLWAFTNYVKSIGAETSLQAGTFLLKPSMTVPEMVEALRTGIAEEGIITIPEGFTVKDIDALLAEKKIIASGALIACAQACDFSTFNFLPKVSGLAARGGKLEGYLYPDTYFINVAEFEPEAFLERLLTTFDRRIVQPHMKQIASSKRSLHQLVTMASLIEEETRAQDERPTVAGILWKRFDANAGLGVDATVRYILEKQTGALTVKDLNTDSPYNLRKFRGLPPGPISTFSLGSFQAALYPKESPYWYYLHGKDGQIHYAETNEEHNVNKYQYLR